MHQVLLSPPVSSSTLREQMRGLSARRDEYDDLAPHRRGDRDHSARRGEHDAFPPQPREHRDRSARRDEYDDLAPKCY